MWIALQSLSQLEAVYGKARAQVLKDNMESQVYYRPTDLTTADYLEHRLGRKSGYAHSFTSREQAETSQGLAEQGIPLLTAQDILQLKDEKIIGFHRRLPPFRVNRIDWRRHPILTQRRSLPAPALSPLPQLEDMPIAQNKAVSEQFSHAYIDPDLLQANGKKNSFTWEA